MPYPWPMDAGNEQRSAAEVEAFVTKTLPTVIGPLVEKALGRGVHAVQNIGGDQPHGDHHDWRYALDVGAATSWVDGCGTRLEACIERQGFNRLDYDFESDLTENGARQFFEAVMNRGVR